MSIVELSGLEVTYGDTGTRPAVRNLSLTIGVGETVAVVGESGSGKSTTANAIIGLLPEGGKVTAGTIRIDGRDVTGASDRVLRELRGSVIGLIPQDPMVGLNPTMRIGAQVAEALPGGARSRTAGVDVFAALQAAGLDKPSVRARQYPHELSGGMRQRVLIAIALAGNPRLIIADEPTSALDVTVQRRILDHLETLVAERGISLLIITHDLGVAADRADRVIVMKDGEIVEQGDPSDILVQPGHAYTRALIASAPALSGSGEVVPRHLHVAPAEEILRLDAVTRDFALPKSADGPQTFRAVDGVSLTARRGQTLAIVGESGSGKTTTVRIALGLERPSAGRVILHGQDVTDLTWRQMRPARRRVQLVQQNPFASIDPRFTVGQAIAEPLVSFGVGSRAGRRARVIDLLEQVSLPVAVIDRRSRELSGGQRQRVAIARALALEPELIVLDEPVSALDVSVQEQILALLADLQDRLGVSFVIVSHDLAVVARVSHHVAVLRAGAVVEFGTTAQVFATPQSEYTRELLDAIPGQRQAAAIAASVERRAS